MPFDGNNRRLFQGVCAQSMRRVKAALEAGANVNGSPEEVFAPIVAATLADHAAIVKVLLEQGADPNRPVVAKISCPNSGVTIALAGERALNIAAKNGRVAVVCLLLEAGADPALSCEGGGTPLHAAAGHGDVDLVDILYSRAPATLNRCDAKGRTPFFLACGGGHESMVSKLLSLGAMQPMPLNEIDMCPLLAAVGKGFVDVVRVLINEGGIRAVRGWMPVGRALYVAVHFRQAIILRLLLTADGEEKRLERANTSNVERMTLLHDAAGCCYPAAVGILLEAGADETAHNLEGRIPLDVIGMDACLEEKARIYRDEAARNLKGRIPLDVVGLGVGLEDKSRMGREKKVAIRRMLQRGPAYRARSWAWPSGEEADAGGSRDGDTVAAAAAAADTATAVDVLLSPPTAKTSRVISVPIFRQKNNTYFFVRLIGR